MCKLNVRQSVNTDADLRNQLEDYYDSRLNDVAPEPEPDDYDVYVVTATSWATAEILFIVGVFNTYDEADNCRLMTPQTDEERDEFYYDVEGLTTEDLHNLNFIGY